MQGILNIVSTFSFDLMPKRLFGFTTGPLFETKQCQVNFLVLPRTVGWLRVYKGG